MTIKIGTKIKVTNTDYPINVPNGTIMTITYCHGYGVFKAVIDGGNGQLWVMVEDTFEVI